MWARRWKTNLAESLQSQSRRRLTNKTVLNQSINQSTSFNYPRKGYHIITMKQVKHRTRHIRLIQAKADTSTYGCLQNKIKYTKIRYRYTTIPKTPKHLEKSTLSLEFLNMEGKLTSATFSGREFETL